MTDSVVGSYQAQLKQGHTVHRTATERQRDKHSYSHTDTHTNRDKDTHKQRDKDTHKQRDTDTHTNRGKDTHKQRGKAQTDNRHSQIWNS